MNILRALVRTAVEVPISAVKDICTLGGAAIDEEPALKSTYRRILEELD